MTPHPSTSLWRHLLLGLGAWLLLAATAWADPPGRVGRIADTDGGVWFYDGERGDWTQALRNRPLTTGDRLTTDAGARAELQVGSTMLRLDGGSDIELLRLDDARIQVQLHTGTLALRVRSREVVDEIEIVTPHGSLVPIRTGHYRIDREGDATLAAAWRGELRFSSHDSALRVTSGQRAEFWHEGPARTTHYTWSRIEHDRFHRWAQSQDARDDRLHAYSRHVPVEMTGADDLDRHGRWENHPEYGTVWIPHHVASNWEPYRDGQWVWVRPWGWTWVDAAPWGFAPFHYGRWVSWHGRWCWAPGHYEGRPVYAPAIVGWGHGSSVSVNVRIGAHTHPRHVGWHVLSPHDHWVPHYHASPGHVRRINSVRVHDAVRPHQPPREPIMYERGLPSGVTVTPSNALSRHIMAAPQAPAAPAAAEPPRETARPVRVAPAQVVPAEGAEAPQRSRGLRRGDDEAREPGLRGSSQRHREQQVR